MKKIIILILGLILVFAIGCSEKNFECYLYGDIYEVKTIEQCMDISELIHDQYETGLRLGEDCSDEVKTMMYNQAQIWCKKEKHNYVDDNCYLVITEGEKPEYYNIDKYEVIPIKTLDTELDQNTQKKNLKANGFIKKD